VRTVAALLTNKAYGYPTRGARRRRKPTILACLHQTANARATAMQERNYANRAGSWGPSATAYIDRDGTVVRAIDPAKYAAWSQGDVASPNRKIPTIAAVCASGVNMNEWVRQSIECSGAGTEPYTDAQFEAVAHLVAAASKALGAQICSQNSTPGVGLCVRAPCAAGPSCRRDSLAHERAGITTVPGRAPVGDAAAAGSSTRSNRTSVLVGARGLKLHDGRQCPGPTTAGDPRHRRGTLATQLDRLTR
jgi:hypothetical protein